MRNEHRVVLSLWTAVFVSSVGVAAASCSIAAQDGSAKTSEVSSDNCPPGPTLASGRIDLSGTRLAEPMSESDETALRSLIRRTFVCGGELQVSAFAGSVASTATLYTGVLHLDGATETARLRREPDATDAVMNEIHERLDAAGRLTNVTVGGTDVLGQLGLLEEFGRQLQRDGKDAQLVGLIVTDGEDTDQLNFADPTLTAASAVTIADAATVPDLSGAQLTIIGVGKSSSGTPAATAHVDAVKAGWNRICERTNAAECTVVTDPANGR